jgi:hypothetical protein
MPSTAIQTVTHRGFSEPVLELASVAAPGRARARLEAAVGRDFARRLVTALATRHDLRGPAAL